jgi:hypothetical protein
MKSQVFDSEENKSDDAAENAKKMDNLVNHDEVDVEVDDK